MPAWGTASNDVGSVVYVRWTANYDSTATTTRVVFRPVVTVAVGGPAEAATTNVEVLQKAARLYHSRRAWLQRIWRPRPAPWPREAFRARYGHQDAPRRPCYRGRRRR